MRLAWLAAALLASSAMASSPDDGGKARDFAHDLRPGGLAEECLRLEAGRSRSFAWTSDKPADFNIHFHQGELIAYPVKLRSQREGRGKFTAASSADYCWTWTAAFATRVTGKLGPEE